MRRRTDTEKVRTSPFWLWKGSMKRTLASMSVQTMKPANDSVMKSFNPGRLSQLP